MKTIAEQLMRKGYDQGINQGMDQARQLWLQTNDAMLEAMHSRGLSKDTIDYLSKMHTERLNQLTEH